MQFKRPVIQTIKAAVRNINVRWAAFAMTSLTMLLNTADASAQVRGGGGNGTNFENFSDYAIGTANNTNAITDVFSYVCYIMGVVLVALGINEMRRIVDGSGGGSLAWRHPLAKLGFGGLFLALPFATAVAKQTMGGEGELDFAKMNLFNFGALDINGGGVSGLMENGINNMGVLVNIAAYASFMIGVFFVVRGIQMLKSHIENPGNAPLNDALRRLAVGGALLSLPLIAKIIKGTFGATGGGLRNTGWNTTEGTAGGLDSMMINFVQDVANPAYYAIEIFCYIAGIVMILFALQRLVRSAQDGPRGPLGAGTIAMFFVSGALLSFPQLLSVLDTSLVGTGTALTRVSFMAIDGADQMQIQNAQNVFSAVLAFMAVVGFLSVVRGLFMLKVFAEGGQATMMQVAVHLVAGSLAINLGAVINALQTSLGLTSFAVTFS